MRYMIIVKATRDSEAGVMPPEHLLAEMAAYHGELAKAGVLVDGSGLQATSKGWRIRYRGGNRSVVDGPFEGSDCEIEVRRMFELEDFGESDTLDRFREIGLSGAEKLS